MEEAQQDLLVVQRELGDNPGLEHGLGGLEGVAVLEAVLLERHDGHLLGQALPSGPRRYEVARALEDVGVVGRRPVVVREHPIRFPDQHHEVGEEEERVQSPGRVTSGVQPRGQLVEADVRRVPRPEEPAVQDPFDGLHHVEVLGGRHAAPRRDHAVRSVDLVRQRLVADALQLA